MALSDWDTLAVDLQGNPTNGVFVSPADVRVSIYKNWVYVDDEKAWHEGCRYDKPCIMEIQHGYVQYMDVHIMAIRGPQEGVYVVVWHENYSNNKKEINGMVGCGVDGFIGDKWVGVTEESKQYLKKWITGTHKSGQRRLAGIVLLKSKQTLKPFFEKMN